MSSLKQADSSSAQPKAILAARTSKKHSLSCEALEEALESLMNQSDPDTWDSCVKKVKSKGQVDSPYAVCTAQLGKPSKKESGKRLNNRYNMKCRLQEGAVGNDSRYRVVLIQEGLGNFKDAVYYDRDALGSAAPLFEGKKIYADHPSSIEEESRPERSTRDILGHFENVEMVESEDGQGELMADLVIPSDGSFQWAKAMCNHAIEYSKKYGDKQFVGLSINASGNAEETDIDKIIESAPDACKAKLLEAKEKGITTVMVVSEISEATSTDLVTEAGAGGKILKLMEEAKVAKKTLREEEGNPEDHADADKDKALFGKMMKKHLGDKGSGKDGEDSGIDEAETEAIHGKYEGYKEMGMKADEAFGHAVKSHEFDKHMKQKKEAADKVEAEKKEAADKASQEAAGIPSDPTKESEKKESARDVAKLAGRVAFLETELNKKNLQEFVDKKLSESKLPRSVTKLFLAKTKGFRNEKDFMDKFDLFAEAFNAERDNDLFVPSFEKTSSETSESGNYSDCVTE